MVRADGDKIGGSQVVVVYYWALWSGPCKFLAPAYAKYEELYPQPKFAKVDVDEQPEIAKEAGVKIMPTFIAYKDGKAIGTALGADRQKLEVSVVFNGVEKN
nr:thioredoxin [Cryptococcus depauperatus CBS 7855]